MPKWPHKKVWDKKFCAPFDAEALTGHGRSPTPPSLSVFFSPFLKSFPFHWGTAAARPSVSGEQNEEERAERSRLTMEGEGENGKKFVSAQSFLGHPWLVKKTVCSGFTSHTQMALPHWWRNLHLP